MSESKRLYSVPPGVLITRNWVAALRETSGRSLDEWLELVNCSGPATENERPDWLQRQHGLDARAAAWIAARAQDHGAESEDPEAYLRAAVEYVDRMFRGARQVLRPIYDELLALGLSFGSDVKACPCREHVPLYRNRIFAQIKPGPARIDLGLALGLRRAQGRLRDSGGFAKKDRISHRIPIATVSGIDAEVIRWFRLAYDEDA